MEFKSIKLNLGFKLGQEDVSGMPTGYCTTPKSTDRHK